MKQFFTLALVATMSLLYASAFAQGTLRGTVKDAAGEALIGASVGAKGTGKSTSTGVDGSFSLALPSGTYDISVSYTGYTTATQSVTITAGDARLNVVLEPSNLTLNEVVISTGSRNTQRTITDSPLPIDIISAKDIMSTGQTLLRSCADVQSAFV